LILYKENKFSSIHLDALYKSLIQGKSISVAFEEQNRFPKFAIIFLELSQETSSLIENTQKIADMFTGISEDRTTQELERMREVRTRAKAGARISTELAGMDAKKSENEFLE